jgi:hypothetical protein
MRGTGTVQALYALCGASASTHFTSNQVNLVAVWRAGNKVMTGAVCCAGTVRYLHGHLPGKVSGAVPVRAAVTVQQVLYGLKGFF